MSGFTIPNTPDALNQNQAEPDSLDFQILGKQKNGVVNGMTVTAGSAETVNVASGEVLINGSYYSYVASTVSLTPYAASNFFDIIVARVVGASVICYPLPGNSGTNPRFPVASVNHDTDVVLASVWRINSSPPASNAIVDKRVFVRSNAVRTESDTVSANRGISGDVHVNTSWSPSALSTASPFSVKVGSTWYNLSYWPANANITTSGTINAGAISASNFYGTLNGNVNGTLDGYDTAVLEYGSTIVVRNGDASVRASHIIANSPSYTSVFSTMLASSVTASVINAQGVNYGYQFRALFGGSAGIPDFSWSGKENYGMYLGGNLAIGFSINGTLRYVISSTGGSNASSRRYKQDIQDAQLTASDFLNIRITDYLPNGSDQRAVGVIAEELMDIESCRHFVTLDEFGNPEAVAYDRLAVAYIELLKDHESRLQALENGTN